MNTDFKKIKLFFILMFLVVSTHYTSSYYNKNNSLQAFNESNKKTFNKEQEKKVSKSYASENKTDKQNKINLENTKQNPQTKAQPSRGGAILNETEITLTFYTGLAEENGGFKEINCIGKKLRKGMVANNVLPLGTKIITNEFGTLIVSDHGGNNFNTIHKLDVYVPRNDGESDSDYFKRVNDMGKVTIKAYIVKTT